MPPGMVFERRERGMSLTLVAISLTAMAAVGALAIDLGMMYKAHAEAQRAAEAAALAGASVFLNPDPDSATAYNRALQLAQANSILNNQVAAGDVDSFAFDLLNERVGVRVGRAGISTWFARFLGENTVRIRAFAAAGTTEASGANCVVPIMIPDAWDEQNPAEDLDGSGWEEPGEQWSYDPQVDSYGAYNPNVGPGGQTGYGSGFRNAAAPQYQNDFGRYITLRQAPSLSVQSQPGAYNGVGAYRLWTFQGEAPEISERTNECDKRSVGMGGGNQYEVVESETLPLGDLANRISSDPGTSWDGTQGGMHSTSFSDWRFSPRVIKVALYNPLQMQSPLVEFNNVALFFLEDVDQGQGTVGGRLLYYSLGNDGGDSDGALMKRVRLVE